MTGLEGQPTSGPVLLGLLLTLAAVLLLIAITALLRSGRKAPTRSLPVFDEMVSETGRAAESGAPLHFALGSGGLGGSRALTSLAALEVLEGLADAAVAYGTLPLVTVGEPTLLPLAEDVLRRACIRQGVPGRYDPRAVSFVSPQPVVYALGAGDLAGHDRLHANMLVGFFEEEASLLTHAGQRLSRPQRAAADRLPALGALYPTGALLAVGEELYAGAAHLTGSPRHLASLRVQDLLRLAVVVVILLKAFGLLW